MDKRNPGREMMQFKPLGSVQPGELPPSQGEPKRMTAGEWRESCFFEAQHMIYYDLPVLVSKIFHKAFAHCECGMPVIGKEDMRFMEGFIEDAEATFKAAMEGQKRQIQEMLKMHEK